MKRIIVLLAIVVAAAAAVVWLRGCFLSDEERIRSLISSMADGFNRSRGGQVADGLAEDFSEETGRTGKREVRGYLVYLFLNERDPKTKEFRHRVEVDDVRIDLEPGEEGKADIAVLATFLTLGAKGFEPAWKIELSAKLERRDGDWLIVRSSHKVLSGRRPF